LNPRRCPICNCPPLDELSVRAVAKAQRVDITTVHRWCSSGRVLAHKRGRAWRIVHRGPRGLDAFVQAREDVGALSAARRERYDRIRAGMECLAGLLCASAADEVHDLFERLDTLSDIEIGELAAQLEHSACLLTGA